MSHPARSDIAPINLFDLLPTEILEEIVDLAGDVLPSRERAEYATRRQVLRRLCQVCHRFRTIAQPLLAKFLWVNHGKLQAILNLIGSDDIGPRIWELTAIDFGSWVLEGDLLRILQVSTNLNSLHIHGSSETALDLTGLPRLARLTNLELDIAFTLASPFIPPSLLSLSLIGIAADSALSVLSPEILPSLRALAFLPFDLFTLQSSDKTDLRRLLSQLDAIFLWNVELLAASNLGFHPHTSRSLLAFNRHASSQFAPLVGRAQHLSYWSDDDTLETDLGVLAGFAEILKTASSVTLRSIYLYFSLEDTLSLPLESQQEAQEFFNVCQRRKIEVITVPAPSTGYDSPLCDEFWSKQRLEKKTSDELEQGLSTDRLKVGE